MMLSFGKNKFLRKVLVDTADQTIAQFGFQFLGSSWLIEFYELRIQSFLYPQKEGSV